MPKWKAEKLIQVYFYVLPLCDSTVTKQTTAIDSLKFALQASQELGQVYLLQRDNKSAEAQTLSDKAQNQAVIHKAEIKQAKRKGVKTGFLGGVGIGLVLILLL